MQIGQLNQPDIFITYARVQISYGEDLKFFCKNEEENEKPTTPKTEKRTETINMKTEKRTKILERTINMKAENFWKNIVWKTLESFKSLLKKSNH